MDAEERLAALTKDDRHYGNYRQHERDDALLMESLGHPMASEYRALRGFFDGLSHACNANARLYTFGGRDEASEYWGPSLGLSWKPEGSLGQFGRVYPAMGERWAEYIRAAARAGWPRGASPSLDPGQWVVTTASAALEEELRSLERRFAGAKIAILRHGEGSWALRLPTIDAWACHAAVVELLDHHHAKASLAPFRKVTATLWWTGARDTNGRPCNFENHYECCCTGEPDGTDESEEQDNSAEGPTQWTGQWSCACNDRCPSCNAETEPHASVVTDIATGRKEMVDPTTPSKAGMAHAATEPSLQAS